MDHRRRLSIERGRVEVLQRACRQRIASVEWMMDSLDEIAAAVTGTNTRPAREALGRARSGFLDAIDELVVVDLALERRGSSIEVTR